MATYNGSFGFPGNIVIKKSLSNLTRYRVATISEQKDIFEELTTEHLLSSEGGGGGTVGGQEGTILTVTNLNSVGAGSFREACEASGGRIIEFSVAGTIDLAQDPISITDPNITINGQTAPAGGITIVGSYISIKTDDVILRYLRIRPGILNVGLDGLAIGGSSENILIDHCSFSWAADESIGQFSVDGSPKNITISWCIIAENLLPHSCGVLTGSSFNCELCTDIDIHHCLFISNAQRNPQITTKTSRVVNNLIHNWGQRAIGLNGGNQVDIIGNVFKQGNDLPEDNYKYEVKLKPYGGSPSYGPEGEPSIYITNNVGINVTDPAADNWPMLRKTANPNSWTASGGPPDKAVSERLTPLPILDNPITEHNVTIVESVVLPIVGASKRIDLNGDWVNDRDATDERLVYQYVTGTGKQISDENEL